MRLAAKVQRQAERDQARKPLSSHAGPSRAQDRPSVGTAPVQAQPLGVPQHLQLSQPVQRMELDDEELEGPLQMFAPAPAQDLSAASIREAAASGIATPSGPMPYHNLIQMAFGSHDISGVEAHVGPKAADSALAMHASAYATGNHVVFGQAPDLHTAAHEAAHVVQQRAGVSLAEGVGRAGDPYERHADAVANRVVAGRSAVDLLDELAPSAGGG